MSNNYTELGIRFSTCLFLGISSVFSLASKSPFSQLLCPEEQVFSQVTVSLYHCRADPWLGMASGKWKERKKESAVSTTFSSLQQPFFLVLWLHGQASLGHFAGSVWLTIPNSSILGSKPRDRGEKIKTGISLLLYLSFFRLWVSCHHDPPAIIYFSESLDSCSLYII